MKKHDFSFTIVIVAENNNPTILNPDFLVRNSIVPENWSLNRSNPILTTPAFSQFEYTNGISFSLDLQRLRIRDSFPQGDIFPVPGIAIKYLETVPHVNYHSLGINFEKALVFDTINEAKDFQRQTFLKDGPWNMNGTLSEFVAKFVYSFSDCQCNISFSSPAKLVVAGTEDSGSKHGLILSANLHRTFKDLEKHNERNKAISDAISSWEKDKENFELITEKLTGGSS